MSDAPENLFPDEDVQEIVEEPSIDEKLDTIIELLKKNEQTNQDEHDEIKGRLTKIEQNQEMLQAAYREHGKTLGELMVRMNGHFGENR